MGVPGRLKKKYQRAAARIEEQTPEGRNRYADFLRALSILVVVLGHWLLAYIEVENGEIRAERLLVVVPWTQWLTWIVQVMPIFFFVGGMANAIGWDSARERGDGYVNWLRRRARRLLFPVVPLLVFWAVLAVGLDWLGTPTDLVTLASQVVLIPVWFLAAYLCVVALSPGAYWLHRKIGIWAVVIFVALAVAVDVAHQAGVPWVGWTNFVWVWGAIHQAGFFWHDGRIPGRAFFGVILAVAGYGMLLFLTQVLDYPISMVGTGEAGRSNNSPPSVALVALGFGQIGLIFLFRERVNQWLKGPKRWAAVVLLGSRLMTVYIWHMTAMVAVAAAAYPTGIWPEITGVGWIWWLSRIPWLILLTLALSILVIAFGRFESAGEARPTTLKGWPARIKAIAGVLLSTLGLALLVAGGLYTAEGPLGLAWVPLIVLMAGLVGLGVVGSSWLGRREGDGSEKESE